jgi:hypothetical protein
VPRHRAAVVWQEDVANVVPWVEVLRPVRIARLDEAPEAGILGVGVPDVKPIH